MNRPSHRSRVGMPQGCRGFSLIELMTVVVIISLLVAILLPALSSARERAQTAAKRAQLQSIGNAADAYHNAFSAYPGYFGDVELFSDHDITSNQNLVISLMGGAVAADQAADAVYTFTTPTGTPMAIDADRIGSGPQTRAGRQLDAFYSPSSDELISPAEWVSDAGWDASFEPPDDLHDIPMIVDPVSRSPVFYSRVSVQGSVPVSVGAGGDDSGQVLYGPYAGGAFPQRPGLSSLVNDEDNLATVLIDRQLSVNPGTPNDGNNVISGGYVLMSPNRHGVFFEQREPGQDVIVIDDASEDNEVARDRFRTDVVHIGGSR